MFGKDTKNEGIIETTESVVVAPPTSLGEFTSGKVTALSKDVTDIFTLEAQMEGVEPRLPQIGIVHRAEMYEMPNETKIEEFTGVIIDHNRTNAWWKISYDESGGNTPPDCSSMDAIRPDARVQNPQCESCIACPLNQFGTETKKDGSPGRGKACKNMKRVHIFLEGSSLPHRLTLPPSNLKTFDHYVTDLSGRGLRLPVILTRFCLMKSQNQDGIDYSEIDLGYVRNDDGSPVVLATTTEEAMEIKANRDGWLSAMRGQEIIADELTSHAEEYDVPGRTGGDAGDETSFSYGENAEQPL